jgi:hypothetical protein
LGVDYCLLRHIARRLAMLDNQPIPTDPRQYEPPKLIDLGTIAELTLSGAPGPNDAGPGTNPVSDRAVKNGLQPVDPAAVLHTLSMLSG